MPREIVILCSEPPTGAALIEAGAAVDPDLGLRTLRGGAVHEICRTTPEADLAVLSVNQPLQVDAASEVNRLLPEVAGAATARWWLEASAPWGALGETGVAIAYELAARLGGTCLVQDGQ